MWQLGGCILRSPVHKVTSLNRRAFGLAGSVFLRAFLGRAVDWPTCRDTIRGRRPDRERLAQVRYDEMLEHASSDARVLQLR